MTKYVLTMPNGEKYILKNNRNKRQTKKLLTIKPNAITKEFLKNVSKSYKIPMRYLKGE